jgi:hypothetical protein
MQLQDLRNTWCSVFCGGKTTDASEMLVYHYIGQLRLEDERRCLNFLWLPKAFRLFKTFWDYGYLKIRHLNDLGQIDHSFSKTFPRVIEQGRLFWSISYILKKTSFNFFYTVFHHFPVPLFFYFKCLKFSYFFHTPNWTKCFSN